MQIDNHLIIPEVKFQLVMWRSIERKTSCGLTTVWAQHGDNARRSRRHVRDVSASGLVTDRTVVVLAVLQTALLTFFVVFGQVVDFVGAGRGGVLLKGTRRRDVVLRNWHRQVGLVKGVSWVRMVVCDVVFPLYVGNGNVWRGGVVRRV